MKKHINSFKQQLYRKVIIDKGLGYKKTYSQSGEDIIIRSIFDALGEKYPSYIDIGAHHPYTLSNTALFYENGSRGINIEPDPRLFTKFKSSRSRDINLNVGVSDCLDKLKFYIMNAPTLNTFSEEEAINSSKNGNYFITDTKEIDVYDINSIIKNHNNSKFPDFLSLDVEGLDKKIIENIDFENHYPKVICVETISFSNSGLGVKDFDLIDYIKDKGYMLYADTYINTIFVKEHLWKS